ncbi:MAG: EVE domain-containing protein [Gammaproteobacteria bacterium]|nr:EVE domain-containing protein [Gammaproteobacteria bacterium]
MKYWLFKSEPSCFSVDDLAKRPNQITGWDGVRNYQARNMMRDDMKEGDQGFFYHSSCDEPGIVGLVQIVKSFYPDDTQFDPDSDHFDPKSSPADPRWGMVDVKLLKKFDRVLTLGELRDHPHLSSMVILRKGNRLSVTPIASEEYRVICSIT